MKETVITITLEGGVIQAVDDIPHGITVRVLDFDTDGAPDENLTLLPNGQRAVVSEYSKEQ